MTKIFQFIFFRIQFISIDHSISIKFLYYLNLIFAIIIIINLFILRIILKAYFLCLILLKIIFNSSITLLLFTNFKFLINSINLTSYLSLLFLFIFNSDLPHIIFFIF